MDQQHTPLKNANFWNRLQKYYNIIMWQSILAFLKKTSHTLLHFRVKNVYFQHNSKTYSLKLSGFLSFYMFVYDCLQTVNIRVYKGGWKQFFAALYYLMYAIGTAYMILTF